MCGCIFETCRTCLVLLVQEVVLDLAEVPVVRIHDPVEILPGAMEGETCIFNAAVVFGFVQKISNAEVLDRVPEFAHESVDEIIVDMVCPEFLQLGIKERVHILPLFNKP